jgi:hypothetical protein
MARGFQVLREDWAQRDRALGGAIESSGLLRAACTNTTAVLIFRAADRADRASQYRYIRLVERCESAARGSGPDTSAGKTRCSLDDTRR